MKKARVRRAKSNDSEHILAIYRPIVEDTVISFEIDSPSSREISRRIESVLRTHEWLVVEIDDGIVGYTYASPYRQRHAYRYSTETAIYIQPDHCGQGLGRLLYEALFQSLASIGYRRAYAAIALPNEQSIALHKAIGFEHLGIFKEAGFKFERWHDVSWWQRKV